MIRVRHYTRVSGRDKILADGRIVAQDQNRVFVELARRQPLSAVQARLAYRLKSGKGAAYVEFNAEAAEVEIKPNKRWNFDEYSIVGDVDLTNRNPIGYDNR